MQCGGPFTPSVVPVAGPLRQDPTILAQAASGTPYLAGQIQACRLGIVSPRDNHPMHAVLISANRPVSNHQSARSGWGETGPHSHKPGIPPLLFRWGGGGEREKTGMTKPVKDGRNPS